MATMYMHWQLMKEEALNLKNREEDMEGLEGKGGREKKGKGKGT